MEQKIQKARNEQRAKAAKAANATKKAEAQEPAPENSVARRSARTAGDKSKSPEAPTSATLPTRRKVSPKETKNQTQADLLAYFDKGESSNNGEAAAARREEVRNEIASDEAAAPALDSSYQPKLVTGGEMRQYQLEGLEWLKTIYLHGSSGILADEMGLGKTIQAISMIAFLKQEGIPGPFIIVAPLSTVENWVNEFAFWTPTIKTIKYYGSKTERTQIRKRMQPSKQKNQDFPVVITSYQMAMNDRTSLSKYDWQYMVVDEGHRLKNMDCKLVKDLLMYNTTNRLLITGTPLQNNLAELWSLLHFTVPEMFDDLSMFEQWFEMYSENEAADAEDEDKGKQVVALMHGILKPVLLRRLKTDVESNLPPKREYVLWAPLMPEQKEIYRSILRGDIREHLQGKAFERHEASKGRTLKRKGEFSGASTPVKSARTSGTSTPASYLPEEELPSKRKSRGPSSYADITDQSFDRELRKLEKGQASILDREYESSQEVLGAEEEENLSRADSLERAKKEMANMKLKNPIMQFRLVCNSPHNFFWPWTDESSAVDFESLVAASGKLLLLDQLLPKLFAGGHKVLIFSQFTSTLDIIESYLNNLRGQRVCRIDGATAQADRSDAIEEFHEGNSVNVFLLTTRAGGVGINLVAADTVILFDSDWNPQQDLQAIDRAHRIGQTRPIIVYRFASKDTVEELLLNRAERKRKLEKMVIHKGKFKGMLENAKSESIDEHQHEVKAYIFAKGATAIADDDEPMEDTAPTPKKAKGKGKAKAGSSADAWTTYPHRKILTEADLAVLTDRSMAAYERAADGKDATGERGAFRATETKRTEEVDGVVVDDQ